jgi:hypothetical protein
MSKIPAEYERDISSAKFAAISRQVCPDSLLSVSAGIWQRDLVNESGMIKTQMGKQYIRKWLQCMERFVQYHPQQ